MHDSAGVYGTGVLGEWVSRLYRVSDGFIQETQRLRFDPDGTFTVLYTTTHASDGSSETDYTQQTFNWRIRVDLVDGRPVHWMEHYGDTWSGSAGWLTYPVEGFGAAGGDVRRAYTRS